jgi:hypothetical protein
MIYGDKDVVLDIADVAFQVGVKASSIKYYWKHGRMPVEDVTFNGTPGWFRQTINDWRPAKAVIPITVEKLPTDEELAQMAWNEAYDPMGAVTFPKAYPTDPQPIVAEWEESATEHAKFEATDEFGGYEPDLGYVIEYGDDESLGMQDALADIESEFGALVNEEI